MNPRSFADIRKAMKDGRAKSRGQLARQVVEAFNAPKKLRRETELKAKEQARLEAELKAKEIEALRQKQLIEGLEVKAVDEWATPPQSKVESKAEEVKVKTKTVTSEVEPEKSKTKPKVGEPTRQATKPPVGRTPNKASTKK